MRKKGISLILLIITIIIIMILVGVVMTTLGDNGMLNQSKKAKFVNDYASLQESIKLYSSDNYNVTTGEFELPLNGYLTEEDKVYINEYMPTLSIKIQELSGAIDSANLAWISSEDMNIKLASDKQEKGYIVDVTTGQIYDYNGDVVGDKRWHTLDGGIDVSSDFVVSIAFSTGTFTNSGAVGPLGPIQIQLDNTYLTTSLEGRVTSSNGIQLWTVPTTGDYVIEAYGAQGGTKHYAGAAGATMIGTFYLTQGTRLKILVGQIGQTVDTSDINAGTGGGGGTFVTKINNDPLVISGGGGGAAHQSTTGPANGFGVITTSGTGSNGSLLAGTGVSIDGNGGYASGAGSAGGGGGFYTNGQRPMYPDGSTWSSNTGGIAFLNGGNGSIYYVYNVLARGGFGGGGSAGQAGGGGGGYSGGASGYWNVSPMITVSGGRSGGGGGSYNSGTSQSNLANSNYGNGKVIITKINL